MIWHYYKTNMNIIAVIPAFNEASTIVDVIQSIDSFVNKVVVVDDGSSDATAQLARKVGAMVISNEINQGYNKSIDMGIKHAIKKEADIIVMIDADGQHNSLDIPRLIRMLKANKADIIVGNRAKKARLIEYIFSGYAYWKIGVHDPICGLKAMYAKVYEEVGYFDQIGSFGAQILFDANKKGMLVKEIDINVEERDGESRIGGVISANYKLLCGLLKLIFHNIKR